MKPHESRRSRVPKMLKGEDEIIRDVTFNRGGGDGGDNCRKVGAGREGRVKCKGAGGTRLRASGEGLGGCTCAQCP